MTAPDAAGIEAALAAGLAAHPSYRYAAKDEDDEKGERHFIRCNGCQARIMAPTYGAQGEVHRAHLAAALLPVVTQAQAEALREVTAERDAFAAAIDRVRRRHPRGDEESGYLAPGLWCPTCGHERNDNGYGGCPDRQALIIPGQPLRARADESGAR